MQMQVPIPYNLTSERLVLHQGTEGAYLTTGIGALYELDEEAVERVMRATVLLYERGNPGQLGACLATALIWELG